MSSTNYPDLNAYQDMDDVTRDEMEYDEEAARDTLTFLYDKTINNEIFKELYRLAALKMFSLELDIGLSILLSYDYLEIFHYCLVSFFENEAGFDSTNKGVVELMKRL